MKPSGPELLLVGSFLITASFSLGVTVCSDSLILPDLVLEDCMFLRLYPVYSGCPVCWNIVVHNIFLQTIVFLWCQLLFLSLLSILTFSLIILGCGGAIPLPIIGYLAASLASTH